MVVGRDNGCVTDCVGMPGIAVMLRTRNVQPSLWESVLPEVCLRLPAELERVDAWLDDERFFAPFVPYFSARMGRPSIPMETYLRLMFLKHRYRLGYETLCAECPIRSRGGGSATSTSTAGSRTRAP
jgi:IS5 family transposase